MVLLKESGPSLGGVTARSETIVRVTSSSDRRERLRAVAEQGRGCRACALHETRTTVVFGVGDADADLMFVGEAPGRHEDLQGLPFVGQAGTLLDKLLAEVGMERRDVFIANTLMCRPPGNRDPHPHELDSCRPYLFAKLELIQPVMVCTLGNFATKLLRGDPTGISRLHGQVEERMIGPRVVRLYPLYHPAAALYKPATLDALRVDFQRIPSLLALGAPAQPGLPPTAEAESEATPVLLAEPGKGLEAGSAPGAEPSGSQQLGLF